MNRAYLAAALPLLCLSAPLAAQAPTMAGDTFRLDGLQVVLPPGMGAPVADPQVPGRYSADDRARGRIVYVELDEPDTPTPAPQGAEGATALAEILAAGTEWFQGMDSAVVVTDEPPHPDGPLRVAGNRAAGHLRGLAFRGWHRAFLSREGAARWARVLVLHRGTDDPAADEATRRMMESVTLEPRALPAGEEVVLDSTGIAFRLPAGMPRPARQPGGRRGEHGYVATNAAGDLQLLVMVKAYPGSADAALRRQLLANIAPNVTPAPATAVPIPDLPSHFSRAVTFVETQQGLVLSGMVRGYVNRTGPVRLVLIGVRRLGREPAMDDPRVREIFDSLRIAEPAR